MTQEHSNNPDGFVVPADIHDSPINIPCAICKSDPSDWTEEQIRLHAPRRIVVNWPHRSHSFETHICPMCMISIRSAFLDPFIDKYHNPLRKKLDKIITAVQEASNE